MFASNSSHHVFRHLNNENIVAPAKGTAHSSTTKTPAASSKQRRALGDISNRKQGKSSTGGSVLPKKAQALRLQPQRNPLATKTPALSKKKEVTFLPRPIQTMQAPSLNILLDLGSSKSTRTIPAQKSVLKNKSTPTADEPVEDIERPAGRLWIEESDDYSCGSVSLPEIDWEGSIKRRQELRQKWREEEEAREDAAFGERVEKALEDDESFSMIGADVWIERTLSFDCELETELSFEAPSFCGEISF